MSSVASGKDLLKIGFLELLDNPFKISLTDIDTPPSKSRPLLICLSLTSLK
jgi:hypothetical protein